MDGSFHGKPYEQMDDLGVFPYFWKHRNTYIPTYCWRTPCRSPTFNRSAEANEVEDAAPAQAHLHLRFAGHRKWAGAYALSKRGLEKLTKSGYAQCTLGSRGWMEIG